MNRFDALRFHRLGNPAEVLQHDRLETQPLGSDEVRIAVHAFALNRADWLYTNGWHYSVPDLPSRIGSECAGTVVEVGEAVDPALLGRKVCTVPFDNCTYGVQGELAVVPASYLAPWADGLTAQEASATWMQYLTAYFALVGIAGIGSDDHLLIPAASSSAGLAAVQIAKLHGARVVATSRSAAKSEAIKQAGADHVLITAGDADLTEEIRRATDGKGVRIAFDPVGGNLLNHYAGALAPNAEIFLYGLLAGEPTRLDLVPLVRANATVRPYSMFNHVCNPEQLCGAIAYVEAAVARGLRPVIDRVFDWRAATDAYRHLDSHSQVGKIVVSMDASRL